MPTYVYKCETKNCSIYNEIFEVVRSFSDSSEVQCSKCDSIASRQITSPTVIYKGSGFYTTDYGSGSKSTNNSQKKKETKSEKKGNNKPKKSNKN
ncbi:MAG: FmdB family transcriptional regulator [Chloroflexi bacterium]|nr:FmdB family transcriptional regulator [Chloroflexota bacterium]